jgi:ABC-type nitrate/sulfonate/bicarbonate transport system ATPase subunit
MTARPDGARTNAASAVLLEHVVQRFGDLDVLDDVSLRVAPGEVVAVVGPSGCGKSSLLDIVCGLAEPKGGTVAAEPAVLMPQRDALLPWLSAIDNAALPRRVAGADRRAARDAAAPVLDELGLAGFHQARPHELSGGMRQRVAFARTLLAGKSVLCLDEPFGALDAITRAEAQTWLADALAKEPRAVLLVTHDVEEALYLSDRVAVLTARPARVAATLDVPGPRSLDRAAAVTAAEFVELRERALRLLAGGAR